MKCDMCKVHDAVVHYAEVVNGEIKKLNICESCAKEKGFGVEVSFSLSDMLGGMVKDSAKGLEPSQADNAKCKDCGMAFDEFKKTGRLGCDNCYVVFEKRLISILDTIHKHTRHRGKTPSAFKEKYIKIEKIRELNKKLKDAVDRENYEAAAVLRDKIKDLNLKINQEIPTK
ncbi:MAG: UvrB/UvrC motif-containing protein [Candidatus Aureabacteria bacterium]|nr:UvrB/UvrC motif-containing protein [Candidatus Auribacterota bacterium]